MSVRFQLEGNDLPVEGDACSIAIGWLGATRPRGARLGAAIVKTRGRKVSIHAPAAVVPDEGDDFFGNVGVVLLVADGFLAWVHTVVEPTFAIDAIDGIDLHLALLNIRANGFDEVETLIFEVVRRSAGEEQQPKAVLSVCDKLHVLAQMRTPPHVDVSAHGGMR